MVLMALLRQSNFGGLIDRVLLQLLAITRPFFSSLFTKGKWLIVITIALAALLPGLLSPGNSLPSLQSGTSDVGVPDSDLPTFVTTFFPGSVVSADYVGYVARFQAFMSCFTGRLVIYTSPFQLQNLQLALNTPSSASYNPYIIFGHTQASYNEARSIINDSNQIVVIAAFNDVWNIPTVADNAALYNSSTPITDPVTTPARMALGYAKPWMLANVLEQGIFGDSSAYFFVNATMTANCFAWMNTNVQTPCWPDFSAMKNHFGNQYQYWPYQMFLAPPISVLQTTYQAIPLINGTESSTGTSAFGSDFFGGTPNSIRWFSAEFYNLAAVMRNNSEDTSNEAILFSRLAYYHPNAIIYIDSPDFLGTSLPASNPITPYWFDWLAVAAYRYTNATADALPEQLNNVWAWPNASYT